MSYKTDHNFWNCSLSYTQIHMLSKDRFCLHSAYINLHISCQDPTLWLHRLAHSSCRISNYPESCQLPGHAHSGRGNDEILGLGKESKSLSISIKIQFYSKNFYFPSLWDLALTLKVPITTAADNIHNYFFIVFQRK